MRTLKVALACVCSVGLTGLFVRADDCGAKVADCGAKSACDASSVSYTSAAEGSGTGDIVETAVSAGSFTTLVAAVKAAGLVDTLKGKGPFTVFAPSDEAFKKLPAGTVEGLLKDIPKLKSILLYHVVPGKVMAVDVVKLKEAKTALGQMLAVDATDGVKINTAKVVKADIVTKNGVIHVIDSVLLPKADLVDTAKAAGSFKTLLAAVEAAGLVETLRGAGPYTVFAPTDEAFGKLPAGTVEGLLKDIPKLKSILLYHVVPGKVTADQVTKLSEAVTAQGQKVTIAVADGVKINDARVVKTDITTGNGVIHVIDSVMLPQ
jgi:transforming growth factor-beta-induced protein